MRKERLHSMSAFMYHCCYIMHLTCCIHKNKWSAALCQRTVISSGSLTLPTFQVEMFHCIHLLQAFSKKRAELFKTFNGFINEFFRSCKWCKRLCAFRLCFHIPRTKIIKL